MMVALVAGLPVMEQDLVMQILQAAAPAWDSALVLLLGLELLQELKALGELVLEMTAAAQVQGQDMLMEEPMKTAELAWRRQDSYRL